MKLRLYGFVLGCALTTVFSTKAQSQDLLNSLPADAKIFGRNIKTKQLKELVFYNADKTMLNRYTYQYSDNGCLDNDVYYFWDKKVNGWMESSRYVYSYDTEKKMAERIFQFFRNGSWINSSHDTYQYTAEGRKDKSVYEPWSPSTETWAKGFNITSYQYNESNLLVESKTQNNTYSYRILYTYDSNNRLREELLQNWDENAKSWNNSNKTAFVYDEGKLQMNYQSFKWKNNEWQIDDKVSNMYDNEGNIIRSDYSHLPDTSVMKAYCIYTYNDGSSVMHSEDWESVEGISIYPNPANAFIQIQASQDLIGTTAYIYDETGKLAQKVILSQTTNRIDVSSLNKGVYFVKTDRITKKLLIQ